MFKKTKNTINEFKQFALKGTVMNLAVGVIIGGAFGKIISSFVSDIFTPVLSILFGAGIKDLTLVIDSRITNTDIMIGYGLFLQNIIDFLIIAFSVFIFVKIMNKTVLKEESESPEPSKEEILLAEIRDLLKNKCLEHEIEFTEDNTKTMEND